MRRGERLRRISALNRAAGGRSRRDVCESAVFARASRCFLASYPLFDEIRACEEAAVESARRGDDGKVIRDKVTVADLQRVRDELDDYTELFLAEAKLWGLILTLPVLEGLESLMRHWVDVLKDADQRAAIAMKSYYRIRDMMAKYQEEFDEAVKKVAVDGLSDFADVLLLTGPLTGLPAFLAGGAIGLAGFLVGFAIEPGEKTQALSVFNGALQGADWTRMYVEWKTMNSGAVVSMELSKKLTGLGLAIDLWSTADVERAARYYERLGFIIEYLYGAPPFYGLIARDGVGLNLRCVDAPPIDRSVPERDVLNANVVVDGVKALFLELRDRGADFAQSLKEQPWGATDFVLRDPDGNLICFASPVDTRA